MIARIIKNLIVLIHDILYKHAPHPAPLTYISLSIDFVRILRWVKYLSVFLSTYDG